MGAIGLWLRRNRQAIDADLAGSPARRYLSPATYAQYRAVLPLLERCARGDVIDLGCGDAPFRPFLPSAVSRYDTLDVTEGRVALTYLGDMQAMPQVPTARYDAALCFEVLEHVPHPAPALREVCRVLKPGGVLVLSVPHLSRLHDEPHDYQRFTVHGLRLLLDEAGLEVVELTPKAGVASFLGHQVSTIVLSAAWGIPGVRQLAWLANKWLLIYPCWLVDRLLSCSGVLPLGYVAVARKAGPHEPVDEEL